MQLWIQHWDEKLEYLLEAVSVCVSLSLQHLIQDNANLPSICLAFNREHDGKNASDATRRITNTITLTRGNTMSLEFILSIFLNEMYKIVNWTLSFISRGFLWVMELWTCSQLFPTQIPAALHPCPNISLIKRLICFFCGGRS